MTEPLLMDARVTELRRAFDESFARPPAALTEATEDLLAVRVSGDAYAIRLRDIDGVVTGRRIVPVPGRMADCLGVAGIRGTPVAVFDLALLLGYRAADDSPKWMVLCGREEPVVLAFSAFEGYLRIPAGAFQPDNGSRGARPHVTEVVRAGDVVRAVIGIPHLVASIRNRAGRRPGQES